MIDALLLALGLSAEQSVEQQPVSAANDVRACTVARAADDSPGLTSDVRWITNLRLALAAPEPELRGRRIAVWDAPVAQVDGNGFWITTGVDECRLYVRPAERGLIQVRAGQLIDLQGEFRFRVPPGSLESGTSAYVYAYIVRAAPGTPRH
jgi:hypothetical protein